MSNSSSQTRNLVSTGAVKYTGGNQFIAPGQLAVIDRKRGSSDGLVAVSDFSQYSKNDPRFILTVGEKEIASSRTRGAHDSMSIPFSINQIVEMGVEIPKISTARVDDWRIGYNGLDADTSFKFYEGMQPLHIRLKVGEGSVPYSGGGVNSEDIDLIYDFNSSNPYKSCVDIDACTRIACKPIIEDIIKTFERRQIGGGRTLGDIVEIYPILSCSNELGNVGYTTWQLSVCDTGDALALANVQASVGSGNVILKRRSGSTSVYQVMLPSGVTPYNFIPTTAGMLPVCDVCSGSAIDSEYLYYITVEDNGIDVGSAIESAAGGGSASAYKQGNSYGVGVYSLVVDSALSPSDIQDLVDDLLGDNDLVATVREFGKVSDFCEGNSLPSISWTDIDECFASTKTFRITLGDDECGKDLLEQLQSTYPSYNVVIANDDSNATHLIELTGTSGTATINVGGQDYTVSFDTDLSTTAANFKSTNQAALLALGIHVNNTSGNIELSGLNSVLGNVLITNVTDDLSGNIGTTLLPIPITGGCMTTYQATVVTDVHCEDCATELTAFYSAEAPKPFRGTEWEEYSVGGGADTSCLCGIGFRGKKFKINPDKCLGDKIAYVEDSTSILVAGAGYAADGALTAGMNFAEPVSVLRVSEKVSRDAVAGNLLNLEVEGGYYFQDSNVNYNRSLRARWSELESRFSELDVQYLNYWLKVQHTKQAGYLEQNQSKPIIYNIFVEIGRHKYIEKLLNSLAGAAGIDGVKAFIY